jgi:hypothetical protein
MGVEKTFYRVRIKGNSPANTKIINGVLLTKQWQVKTGDIGDLAKFSDVEAQVVVKQGNAFVPAEEGSGEADDGEDEHIGGNGHTAQPDGNVGAGTGSSAADHDFTVMTVEQLKNFLISEGVAATDLRNVAKAELIAQAEAIWLQNNT